MEFNKKNIKIILLIILFSVITFSIAQNFKGILGYLSNIVSLFHPVVVALCIAFVLNVLLTVLETKVFSFMKKSPKKWVNKAQRPLCLVLTYLIALGVVTLIILVVIPELTNTIISLSDKFPSFMNNARIWLEHTLGKFKLTEDIDFDFSINWTAVSKTVRDFFMNYSKSIFGSAVNITSSVVSGIFNTIFSFMISVYVLAQKEKIEKFVRRCIDAFIPKKGCDVFYHLCSQTYYYFSKFIGGQLTESCILGMLFFIGMTIFRFPNAPIISVVICATSFVPVIGATIGVIFGCLLILIVNPIKAFFFIIFYLVVQQLENNLIYPKVVGKSVGLPGVIVVCAVLVGGNMGGITGTLIAVPVSAVLFALLKEAVDKCNERKAKKSEYIKID